MAIVAGLWLLTAVFGAFQTWRVKGYQADVEEYISKISALEQAVQLTETLRKDNADLTQEYNDLIGKLRGTAGYKTPLTYELRSVLGRVQRPVQQD